jgi:hypothetical protein
MKEVSKNNNIFKKVMIALVIFASLYYVTIVKAKEMINITIQGDVGAPGVFKVPMNSTLADVIGKAKPTPTSDLAKLDLGEALTQSKTITVLTQDYVTNPNYREYQRTTVYNNQKVNNNKNITNNNNEINETTTDNRICASASKTKKPNLLNLNTATEKEITDRFGKYGLKISESLNIVSFRNNQQNQKITSICQLIDARVIYSNMANLIVNEVYLA